MAQSRWLIVFLIALLFASASSFAADLSISLPLGPWYRPGKYIPVHIAANLTQTGKTRLGLASSNVESPSDISLGAGRVSIELSDSRVDAVVPWFVTDGRAKRPRVFVESPFESADGPELKPLGESERMVGWTTPDPAFARELLHGPPKLIPIALDPAKPIDGNPACWEMLDAIILDADSASRLVESQISGLLAGGVTIAVKTASPPFPKWPWKRMGDYSVLKYNPAGPEGTGSTSTGFHDKAFLPISDWLPGRTWDFRKKVLIAAAVCCILILALALWRPRMTWLWTIVLVGAMSLALGKWWATTATVRQAGGEIIVLNPSGLTQTDTWTYQSSSAPRPSTMKWRDITRPIFASRSTQDDIWTSLKCDPAGQPIEFNIKIPANRKVAFLSRSVGPHSPKTPPDPKLTSPLVLFANQVYLNESARSPGQLPAGSNPAIEQWNAVVVENAPKK
jgi:hypothetical protein